MPHGRGAEAAPAPRKHTVVLQSVPFEVDVRYTPTKLIGRGAYGLVCAARVEPPLRDPLSEDGLEREVAIKKIQSIFAPDSNIVEAKRTLREICLLRSMAHENVLSIRDVLLPLDVRTFSDAYIVVEKMDSDMHRIIQSKQALSADHTRFFVYQLLRGLKYIHSAGVIHRDLKPGNLLLNANCDLKISDFGLARTIEPESEAKLTQYVVTRWYRAPEILLLATSYTTAVDIWSAGCIFAELLGRRPLFPGRTHLHQLQLILARLGTPSADERGAVPEQIRSAIETALSTTRGGGGCAEGASEGGGLHALLPDAPPGALELLSQMLRFDPRQRITAAEALAHPYLADLHEEEAEPSAPHAFALDELDGPEAEDLDWGALRRAYVEIAAEYAQAHHAPTADAAPPSPMKPLPPAARAVLGGAAAPAADAPPDSTRSGAARTGGGAGAGAAPADGGSGIGSSRARRAAARTASLEAGGGASAMSASALGKRPRGSGRSDGAT